MPARLPRLPRVAVAVLRAPGLPGCAGGDPAVEGGASTSPSGSPTSSPTPSRTSAATGTAGTGRLSGEGYALTLPEGWEDASARFQEYSELIDTGAVNAAQAGQAFSDNLNVLRNGDQVELPEAEAERQFAEELGTVAKRVQVLPRTTVGGVGALHLTGRTDAGAVTVLTDQYISFVDGAYYLVTFSHSHRTPPDQRRQEVSTVLDSWAWG